MKKIVILGGGFGGVEFYKTLHKKLHGSPEFLFQLISRWNYFLFYPLLHEVATGAVERAHVTQPLREIVNCCVEQFVQAEVEWVDVAGRRVRTSAGEFVYDYLVLALGVATETARVRGATRYAMTLQSINDAVRIRNCVIHNFERAARESDSTARAALLSFVIIGGGAVGVELAGQLVDWTQNELRDLYGEVNLAEIKITLLEGANCLLRQFAPAVGLLAQQRLEKLGVRILTKTLVTECLSDRVLLDNGEEIMTGLPILVSGNCSLLRDKIAGEFLTTRGGIKTNQYLQLVDHPEVFAIGDGAEIVAPLQIFVPQTAQAAAAMARTAADNLWRLIQRRPLRAFEFQSRGDLVPIGNRFAIGQIGAWVFFGFWAWWLRRGVFLRRIWSPVNRIKICVDWLLRAWSPRDTSEL